MSEQLIRAAIGSRRVITFYAKEFSRTGEPHLLGISRKTGSLQVELFQTAGGSVGNKGPVPAWRRFDVAEISRVVVTDLTFVPQSDFNPYHDHWEQVSACVA